MGNLFGPGQNGKSPGDGVCYYPNQGAKYKADIKHNSSNERGGVSQPPTQPQQPQQRLYNHRHQWWSSKENLCYSLLWNK